MIKRHIKDLRWNIFNYKKSIISLWVIIPVTISFAFYLHLTVHNIKDANLTNEQVMSKVEWQTIRYLYKKRLLSYMHIICYENYPHLL